MARFDRTHLAQVIVNRSPGWSRVGLSMPNADLRARAADANVGVILDEIDPQPQSDPRQLALAL